MFILFKHAYISQNKMSKKYLRKQKKRKKFENIQFSTKPLKNEK